MRYTQEQMQAAISEWQNSGLSKKAFCRDRKITYQTFHYWCKKLSPGATLGFAEVKLGSPRQSGEFELTFPSGARMTFQGEPSVLWLRELLSKGTSFVDFTGLKDSFTLLYSIPFSNFAVVLRRLSQRSSYITRCVGKTDADMVGESDREVYLTTSLTKITGATFV